jgi:hypothetical protein
MAVRSKIEVIEKYLDTPQSCLTVNSEQDPMSMYFLSFMGDLFIQGYKVFENINSHIVILSLMQYGI